MALKSKANITVPGNASQPLEVVPLRQIPVQLVKHWVLTSGSWTTASPGYSYTISNSTAPVTGSNLSVDQIDLTKPIFLGIPAPMPSGTVQQNRDNAEALCTSAVIIVAKTATSITLNAKSIPQINGSNANVTIEIAYIKSIT